jgi:alpha-tubulin suppressor-like RCC1 family protein
LALKKDGTVVAWGGGSRGYHVPEGLKDVKEIETRTYHTIALKEDGSIVVWGTNLNGQCNVHEDAKTGVAQIAAGGLFTAVLLRDGTMHSWGAYDVKLIGGYSKLGDLDGDGIITSTDVTYLKRYILKQIKDFPVPNDMYVADLDSDGNIDSYDLTLMKRCILKGYNSIEEFLSSI